VAPPPGEEAVLLDLERLVQVWPAVIESIRANGSGPTASYFEGSRPTRIEPGRVEIGFAPDASFNRRNAEKPDRKAMLVKALFAVTGEKLAVTYGELDSGAGSVEEKVQTVGEEEFVERLKSEFNAEEVI
ncbi:MAG: hypothetical protein WBW44_07260, partial [Solirubrobacterales bacterium]